jgi:hypothetical protein
MRRRAMSASRILALWLGSQLFFVAVSANASEAIGTKFQWRRLGDGTVQMRVLRNWTFRKSVAFESETYTASEQREPLFLVYLGNNPAFHSIRHDRVRVGKLNGNAVRRYISKGVLTDVIITPRCGHDTYIWLTRATLHHEFDRAITAAFGTLRCT